MPPCSRSTRPTRAILPAAAPAPSSRGRLAKPWLPASCDLDAALALPGTKVLMKSGSAIHETVAALGRAGLLKRASMVADCGLPSERVFRDLREIPENVSYFATILVRSE